MEKLVIVSKVRVAEIRRSLLSEGYKEIAAVSFDSYWAFFFRHHNGNRIKLHVSNVCINLFKNRKLVKTEWLCSGGAAAGGKSTCPPAT